MQQVSESQQPTRITATTAIRSQACCLLGIFVASASATPTISVTDGGATVIGTFTPLGGQFYAMPINLSNDLTVVISGTVDCTVIWNPVR